MDELALLLVGMGLLLAGGTTASVARGQGVSPDSVRHQSYQVGIAASSLFKLLEEGNPTQQYQVYGRYWTTSRRMGRAAVRYRHVVGGDNEVDIGLRGGAAWVFRSVGRWRFYGGGDVIAGYERFANGQELYRGGVSPLFGALFFVGRHVSLSVEPHLVATYTHSRGRRTARSRSNVVSVRIKETARLILSVHF